MFKKILLLLGFKEMIKKLIKDELKNNKDKVVEFINSKIDIPFLNEEEEKERFNRIYEGIEEFTISIVDKL